MENGLIKSKKICILSWVKFKGNKSIKDRQALNRIEVIWSDSRFLFQSNLPRIVNDNDDNLNVFNFQSKLTYIKYKFLNQTTIISFNKKKYNDTFTLFQKHPRKHTTRP